VSAYAEALAAIESRGRFGIRLGLGRVRALLRELGSPEARVRGALVAGTNGKGSVIALASPALRAAGYLVGETPKPHLVSYRERIVVDGRPISPGDFTRLVGLVLPIADRIAPKLGHPTEFELLTAMMFRHFADVGVEVALVEVGLGGRLDATNAWDGGVAVLTNVGLDHMDRLGDTIGAIAREKVAIVKRGDLAVTGADGEALAIMRRRCARLGVPLVVTPPARVVDWTLDALRVDLAGLGTVDVGLRGRHQAANVAVAAGLLDALASAGIATTPDGARRDGFAGARWAGRLELIDVPAAMLGTARHPRVLLDGAHNPDGAATLARSLDDLAPWLGATGAGGHDAAPGSLALVWAAMADKDVAGVIGAVAASRTLDGATIVCTAVDAPRAMDPAALAAAWRAALGAPGARGITVRTAATPDAALDLAVATGAPTVVVAGSLYLVGAVRARLVDDPDLRDP
jgi:dihydrofolate synthase/folylpolyglutamate synthase